MKMAVIGANGKAGRCIVREALERGHEVLAVVRGQQAPEGAELLRKDLYDLRYDDLAPYTAIVDAFGAWSPETLPQHETSLRYLADLLSGKENRLLIVGGAGSLYVDAAKSMRVMDTPDFPEMFLPLAQHMAAALEEIRQRTDVKWTYLSPAADFAAEGERTGGYQTGEETLLLDSSGQSRISYADYAIAMVDEAERALHVQQRFTVVQK